MIIEETSLKGCFVIEPKVFEDSRGYFFESYNEQKFAEIVGKRPTFVQSNQSKSSYGVLRGLHLQNGDSAQAKLVRVLKGEVLDVAVDLRPGSITFGKHVGVRLSEDNKKQLYIPRGFAHGFVVLSEEAKFFYMCDNFYDPSSEGGLIYNDKALGIDWVLSEQDLSLSEKDLTLPKLSEL